MEDRPDRAVADRHRFLQAADVPVDLPQQAGHDGGLPPHQPHQAVRLADLIDEGELREQLDHVRTLRLSRGESTWLRGNTFYGKRQMFRPDFMEWFEGLRLPPYHLEKRDGQFELTFEGKWPEVMLWEIPALAVLMELRSRAVLKRHGPVRAAGALCPRDDPAVGKDRTAAQDRRPAASPISAPAGGIPSCGRTGACRRCWKGWGRKFTGTSNCLIAMRREVEAIGTNAHELPMVYSALADTDAELRAGALSGAGRLARGA